MGLSKKTFLYSILLAAVMTVFITGYFVFMLPSLYVSYVMRSNLESVTEIHKGYMEDKSYDNLTVKNPSSTYSLEIPREGNRLFVSGKFFRLTIDIQDEELQSCFGQIRDMAGSMEPDSIQVPDNSAQKTGDKSLNGAKVLREEDFAALWNLLKEKLTGAGNEPLAFKLEPKGNQGVYQKEYSRIHTSSDGFAVFEAGVADSEYSYTTYVAFSAAKDSFLITVLPTMTPQMDEIRPIVAESLPMIVTVIFLLVLLASRFFSGQIVNPIIRLSGQAASAAIFSPQEGALSDEAAPGAPVFDTGRRDEIGVLSHTLSRLYERLYGSYMALAEKNKILEEENLRQEVFLRATSHQLKTPIAAALLLVEGMKGRVGKYKDTNLWLPEVKKQLLSMRKIVEDVLSLNYHTAQMQPEAVALDILLQELLHSYAVQIENKSLKVNLTGAGAAWGDPEILKKILDNLLSNAIQYTPPGERIEIAIRQEPSLYKAELSVINYGITVSEELLPNLFDPFVTSSETKTGKGLGLYVAAYYSRLCGMKLTVKNGANCVCALLEYTVKIPNMG